MSRISTQDPARRKGAWAGRIGTVLALALVGALGVVTPAQAAVTTHVIGWEAGEPSWQYINWGHSVGRSTHAPVVRSGSWGVRMMESSMSAASPGEARRTFTYATTALSCGAHVHVRNLSPTNQKVRVSAHLTGGSTLNSVIQTLPANSGWTKVSLGAFAPNAKSVEIRLYAYPFTSTGLLDPYWAEIGWDDFSMSCIRP